MGFLASLLLIGAAFYLIVHYWDRLVKGWAEAHGVDTSKWDE